MIIFVLVNDFMFMNENSFEFKKWYFSWMIVDANFAVKLTDWSIFKHNGSQIPKNVSWFFKADQIITGDPVNIVLILNGKEYKGSISRNNARRPELTPITWHKDFSKMINSLYPDLRRESKEDEYPFMFMRKMSDVRYEISFSGNFGDAELVSNNNSESIVTVHSRNKGGVIIKKTNPTFFEWHTMNINQRALDFFDVNDLKYGSPRIEITVNFNGTPYSAYLKALKRDRIRMFWRRGNLKNEFNKYNPADSSSKYPVLEIRKVSKNEYDLEFVLVDDFEEDSFATKRKTKIVTTGIDGKPIVKLLTTTYERKSSLRKAAISIHGTKCMVCGFDFGEIYGDVGEGFIEVHHLFPLSDKKEEVAIDIKTDLACVCSNCHSMFHRKRDVILSIEDLREIVRNNIRQ